MISFLSFFFYNGTYILECHFAIDKFYFGVWTPKLYASIFK